MTRGDRSNQGQRPAEADAPQKPTQFASVGFYSSPPEASLLFKHDEIVIGHGNSIWS